MSYSFTVTAASKDEAGKKVEEQLSQIVLTQPRHKFDRQAVQNAVEAFIDVLADPSDDQKVCVYVVGSLSMFGDLAVNAFCAASVSVSADIRAKN